MEVWYPGYRLEKALHIEELISLFYYKGTRDYHYDGESHNFWEFIYIDKGRALITAGDKQYVLKTGEMAFHKPGEFHAVRAYDGTASSFIISAFVCKAECMRYFEHQILTLTAREREYLYEAVRHRRLAFPYVQTPHVLADLAGAGMPVPFGEAQMIQANLELLLLTMLCRGESARIQPRVESYAQQTRNRQLSEKVKEYLEEHLGESLTLEEIGSALGYSVSQMKKLFRQENGRGIIDYFIELKMNEAKRLIREGDLSLSEIAARVGYENPGYFSRIFRQKEGMTPSQYGHSAGFTPA